MSPSATLAPTPVLAPAPTPTALEALHAQFDEAARLLSLDDDLYEFLKTPYRELHVQIPVRMDNGRLRIFRGYRVQHNAVRGPYKGLEVRVVSAFQEVAAWLMLYWDSAVLVLHPPAIDTFRRATLQAIRKVAPEVPIVALVPGLSAEIKEDLDRARVTRVLTTDAAPAELLSAVRKAGAQRQTKSPPHTDGGEE